MANDMYPQADGEGGGWTLETALYVDSDYDEEEGGELEENDFPLMDVKPDVEANQEPLAAWKVFRIGGGTRGYLQPDVKIVPDIEQTVIGKKAIEHTRALVAARKGCPNILRHRTRLLKRLNDSGTCWGLVKGIAPGQDGGCRVCVGKVYECIVRLEWKKDASAGSGVDQRVIGRCLGCSLFPDAPGCDIVVHSSGNKASEQVTTSSEKPIPFASADNPMPDSPKVRILRSSAAVGRQLPVALGPGPSAPTPSLVTESLGSMTLDSCNKRGKRKILSPSPPNALPSPSARAKRSRIIDPDLDATIAAPTQATVSDTESAAVRPAIASSTLTAGSCDLSSPTVIREAALEVVREVRDQANRVELEIVGSSPHGLDPLKKALFKMMAHQLGIIERAMTSAPSVPPVGKIEALEAVDFLPQFAAEAGKLIVGDNEDSLGFLFVNMFKMMSINTEVLRKAANQL